MKAVVSILVLILAGEVAAAERQALAVMAIEGNGISAEEAATLSEVLTTELTALGRFQVISARDIEAMLKNEANKQALGCNDTSCFAEIGGALGADTLLQPQVSKLAGIYVVNIKLIDVKRGKIVRRVYERVDGDLEDVLEAIRYSLSALTDPEGGEGVVRGRPAVSTAPLVLGSASLVALGVGVGFGLKAKSHYQHATDPSYAGGQLEIESGEDAQRFANFGYGAAALTGLASAILYLVWDSSLFDGDGGAPPEQANAMSRGE